MKTVIAGALGECVHVAGVSNFLRLAELAGWHTVFLGPAVSIQEIISAALHEKADLVGVSYRLTPETGEKLLADFINSAKDLRLKGVKFAFGGTPPVARIASAFDFFEAIFDGSEFSEDVLSYLKGEKSSSKDESHYPQTTIERRLWKAPYPLLRHHFGLPAMETTVDGVKKIAKARVLDVISLGTDQDAQENFFRPDRQDIRRKGAGGVPVRSADDLRQLYEASRIGNYPLMRTYSGTDDFIRQAELFLEAIRSLARHISKDPFTDPETLAKSVMVGIMDAPQLKNNPFAKGEVRTAIIGGTCVAVDAYGCPISEELRLKKIFIER